MATAGRKPKPEGQSRTRHKRTHDSIEVVNLPYEDGPKLPRYRPDGEIWPKATRNWWQAIASMPHASLWTESEWKFAFDTAFVAAKFHEGDLKAATELRNREKVLGTTYEYRRDLRIKYIEPEPEEENMEVTRLDDYRDL